MKYFWGWGRVQKLFWGLLIWTNNFSSEFCSISALSCSFEFQWGVAVVVGGGGSQRLLSLNPTTVLVVLLLGLWCGCCVVGL